MRRLKRFVRILWRRFISWGKEQLGFFMPIIYALIAAFIIAEVWYYTLWPLAYQLVFHRLEATAENDFGSATASLCLMGGCAAFLFGVTYCIIRGISKAWEDSAKEILVSDIITPEQFVQTIGKRMRENASGKLGGKR